MAQYSDGSKTPENFSKSALNPYAGVVDFGNLFNFTPYEGGYCFLSVLNAPKLWNADAANSVGLADLQTLFVQILEKDLKSVSGIDDKTADTYDYGPSTFPLQYINSVKGLGVSTIGITVNMERSGTPINKYISKYLDYVRDPLTKFKSYNGAVGRDSTKVNHISPYDAGMRREVFNMLYIITDATGFNIEKAYLLLNMFPVSTIDSELFNVTKGDISVRETTINFTGIVYEGVTPNKIAAKYMQSMIEYSSGRGIMVDSKNYNWSVSGVAEDGGTERIKDLGIKRVFGFNANKLSSTKATKSNYVHYKGSIKK